MTLAWHGSVCYGRVGSATLGTLFAVRGSAAAATLASGVCRHPADCLRVASRTLHLSTPAAKVQRSEAEWTATLTPEEYRVCRSKGTEEAWSGEYNYLKADGTYKCSCCGAPLFTSKTKFDSGSGWPSFFDKAGEIDFHHDNSYGMSRVEVTCANCDAHLGHVFDDGPKPTGQRYCINSVSLRFEKEEGKEEAPPK